MGIRAAIVGATGYTGGELVRLLLQHPQVEVTVLMRLSTEDAVPLHKAHPFLRGVLEKECVAYDEEVLSASADVVFLATPNGKAMELAPSLLSGGLKVIDLSADYRLKAPGAYEQWYALTHVSPQVLEEAVYGLPELHRDSIKTARLIANPGCYPISAIIALAPLLREELVDTHSIVVDSKSGVSGAGRSKLTLDYHFPELNEDFRAYNVASHRHTPEIEQELSALCGEPITLTFTPHLLPITRGILTTAYARLKRPTNTSQLHELYISAYSAEPFVRVLDMGELPRVKSVMGSNFCDLSIVGDERTQMAIVLSAIDNLTKGASGIAIQNMNLMFGLEESTGLRMIGLAP